MEGAREGQGEGEGEEGEEGGGERESPREDTPPAPCSAFCGPRSCSTLPPSLSPQQAASSSNSPGGGDSGKRRRLWGLRGLVKMFRRRVRRRAGEATASPQAPPPTLRARSTSELAVDLQYGGPSGPYNQGLSVSHDSVFTPDTTTDHHHHHHNHHGHHNPPPALAIATRGVNMAELKAALRHRRADDSGSGDDDPGLPRSPPTSPTTLDVLNHGLKASSRATQSTCSDGSLLSMGSSENDEDSLGAGSHHSSKVSLLEGRHQVVDNEPVAGAVPLNHQAALHKIAVRPRRTHGAPRSRRATQIGGQISLPDVIEEANNRNLSSQKLLAASITTSTATSTSTTAATTTSSTNTTTVTTTSTPSSGPLPQTQGDDEEERWRRETEEEQRREAEEGEKEEKREEPLFQRLFGSSSNKRAGRRASRGRGEDSRENSVSPLRHGGEQRTSREGKRRDSSGSRFPGGAVSKSRQDPPHPLPPSGRPREPSRERSSSGTCLGAQEVSPAPTLACVSTPASVIEAKARTHSDERHAPRPVSYPARPSATPVRKVKSFREMVGGQTREPLRPRAPSQTDSVEVEETLPRTTQAARLSASLESIEGGEGVGKPQPNPSLASRQAQQDLPPASPQRSSTESLATTPLPGVFIRPHPTSQPALLPQTHQDIPGSAQESASGPFSLDSSVGVGPGPGWGRAEVELRKAASVDHMGAGMELAPVHRRQRHSLAHDTKPTSEPKVVMVEAKADQRKAERKVDLGRSDKIESGREERKAESEAREKKQESMKFEKRSDIVKAEKRAEGMKAGRKQENLKAEKRSDSLKTEKKQESMKVEKRQEYVTAEKRQEYGKTEKKSEVVKVEKRSEIGKPEKKQETAKAEKRQESVKVEKDECIVGEVRRASGQLLCSLSGPRGEDTILRSDTQDAGEGELGATPPRRPLRKEPSLKRSAPHRDSEDVPVPEFMRIQLNRVESKGQAVIYDTEQERNTRREAPPPSTQPLSTSWEGQGAEAETEKKEEQSNPGPAPSKSPVQLTNKSSFQGLRNLLRDGAMCGVNSESESVVEAAAGESPGDRVQLRKPSLVAERVTAAGGGGSQTPPPVGSRDQPELFKVFARRSFKVKDSDKEKFEMEEDEEEEGQVEAAWEVSEVTVTPIRAPAAPLILDPATLISQDFVQKSSINAISFNRKSVGNPALSFIPPSAAATSANFGSPLAAKPMALLSSSPSTTIVTPTTSTSSSTSPSLEVGSSGVARNVTTITNASFTQDTPRRSSRTPSPAAAATSESSAVAATATLPGEVMSRIISSRLSEQPSSTPGSETSSGVPSPAQVRTTQPATAHTRPPLTSRPSASLIWPPRPQQEQEPEEVQKCKVTPTRESEGSKVVERDEVEVSPLDIMAARRRFMRSIGGSNVGSGGVTNGSDTGNDGGNVSSAREHQDAVSPSPSPLSSITATPIPSSTTITTTTTSPGSSITSSILSRAATASPATTMPLFTVTLRTQPAPATPVIQTEPSPASSTTSGEQGTPEKGGEAEDWRVLVRQRREGRLKQTKTPDAEEIIIETRPTVSRNSKVLEMASNFQKLQVA